jgi:glycosyltransferase involved in cell wall biosynthesis
LKDEIIYVVVAAEERDPCGVERYARNLSAALREEGARAELVRHGGSLFSMIEVLRFGGRVLLNYPCYRSGSSLGFQLVPLFSESAFLVLHEFRSSHFLRRTSLLPVLRFARRRVFFVDETESPFEVEPLGAGPSLVPPNPPSPSFKRRLIFLGRLREDKDLPLLWECLRIAKTMGFELVLCGGGEGEERFDRVVRDDDKIRRTLLEGGVGVATFRGGASRKRTSLITLLNFGLPVLLNSLKSDFLSEEGDGVLVFGGRENFEQALKEVEANYHRMVREALESARRFSWRGIAKRLLKKMKGGGNE